MRPLASSESQSDRRREVAIVVGGSGSIGSEIATRLASGGVEVINFDKRPGAASSARFVRIDVRDLRRLESEIAAVARSYDQHIDHLVYCAGILGQGGRIDDVSWEIIEDTFQVNFLAAAACCRSVIPIMRQRGSGNIVLIGSIAADMGSEEAPAYSASKSALIGWTRGVAKQVGRHQIRVNCVSPGSVGDSNFSGSFHTDGRLSLIKALPLRSLVTTSDVADCVAFLCSSRARAITGENISVSGGEQLVGP